MKQKYMKFHFNFDYSYQNLLFFALCPLVFYGFYKNGILPYLQKDVSFLEMFRPILFPSCGFFIGWLVMKDNKKKNTINFALYGFLIGMILPIKSNLWVTMCFLFFLFLLFRMKKMKKFSPLIFSSVFLLFLINVVGKIPFENQSEITHQTIYTISDIFFGRNVGGVCNTSIFLALFGLIFLSFDYYYKKEIPISILISYTIFVLFLEFLFPSKDLLRNLLNSSTIFASIFLAGDMEYSPYMEKGKILYGVVIGLSTAFWNRITFSLGIYIAICFASLFIDFFDNFAIQLEKK